eukprot:153188_1
MVSDFTIGTLLSFVAAILFGVHTSFAKTKSVIESGVAMPIYNIYFLIGAAITCFIEYFIVLSLGATIQFTYLGIICALLLLCFEVFLLLSIQQIGVGYATGFSVFSSSVITPILQVILNQPIAIWWLMIIGLLMLAFSVFLMSILRDALKWCGISHTSTKPPPLQSVVDMHATYGDVLETLDEHSPLITTHDIVHEEASNEEMEISRCAMILGLVFSSLAGIFMAVLPLPSLYTDEASAGLNFFVSFGIGCLIVIPLSAMITVFTHKAQQNQTNTEGKPTGNTRGDASSVIPYELLYQMMTFDDRVWHFGQVVIPAVSAGIVWSIGNICGFCSFLYLSYTIAVSFVQCNVIVAMILGVLLWKEITNKMEIFVLFLLSLVLVGGCAVVVYGVFGSF